KVEGVAAGADDYLVKPFSARELIARVYTQLALARMRRQAEATERAHAAHLATELDALSRLQQVSTRLVQLTDRKALLLEIVDAAIALTGSDMGNIQLRDPQSGILKIVASRGFEPPFLEFFNAVRDGDAAACGAALQSGERVVIEDVTASPVFVGTPALDVVLAAGVQAVQSTPLVDRSGRLVGMLSTHYRASRRPADRDLRLLDVLARQAADSIERTQAEEALRQADSAKNEYLAMLGHELRSPLGAITSAITVHGEVGEEQAGQLRGIITRQARQLARLVDDLLDVGRLVSGKLKLRRKRMNLKSMVEYCLAALESQNRLQEHRVT